MSAMRPAVAPEPTRTSQCMKLKMIQWMMVPLRLKNKYMRLFLNWKTMFELRPLVKPRLLLQFLLLSLRWMRNHRLLTKVNK